MSNQTFTKIKGYHRNYMLMLIIVPHCSTTLKAISRGSCRFVNAAFACQNCKSSEAKTKITLDECEIACLWLNLSWTWMEQLPESGGSVSDLTSNDGIRMIPHYIYNIFIVSKVTRYASNRTNIRILSIIYEINVWQWYEGHINLTLQGS